MQNDMIQIRNNALLARPKDPDRIPEAVVIPFQLLLARAENGIKPMTEKLDDEPEDQNAQQDPLSDRTEQIIGNKPCAIQAEHDEFGTFDPHAFYKLMLTEPIRYDAAQKPDPQGCLKDDDQDHSLYFRKYCSNAQFCISENIFPFN